MPSPRQLRRLTNRGLYLANPGERARNDPSMPPGFGRGASLTPIEPERFTARTPIIDILPDAFVFPGWFTTITLPDPLIVTANMSAWYGLGRIKVEDTSDQEFSVIGVECVTLPTDSAGTGGGNSVAWGSTTGQGAAVVVGRNLAIQPGAWSSAPFYGPGVEASGASILTTGAPISPYIWQGTFPTGKYTDTTPNRLHVVKGFAPGAVRCQAGSTLDIALVVRRSQMDGNGTRVIYGHVHVQVLCARTHPGVGFSY